MPMLLRINGMMESIKTALNPQQAPKKTASPMQQAVIPSPPPSCASEVAREGVDRLMAGVYGYHGRTVEGRESKMGGPRDGRLLPGARFDGVGYDGYDPVVRFRR